MMVSLLLNAGCGKKAEQDKKEKDVSLSKKYSKWNFLKVYKEAEFKKRIEYLSKGEEVDLLDTKEYTDKKNNKIEVAKIKLSDDKIGFVKMNNLADHPVIFLADTKAYVRNNIGSRVYHTIPGGTLGFKIAEKGDWIQIYIGNLYTQDGKKWVDKKWVKGGYSMDLNLLQDARLFEEASIVLFKANSSENEAKKAIKKLKDLTSTDNLFAQLAKEKLVLVEEPDGMDSEDKESDKKIAGDENIRTVKSASGLRMRNRPDISGEKIDTIPDGEKVELIKETGESITISGKTGKWTMVKWGEKSGWVFGGFLLK